MTRRSSRFARSDRHVTVMRVMASCAGNDRGGLAGVLSQKDCLKVIYGASYHQDWGGTVSQYMSREVEHIDAGSSILDAAEKFLESHFRRFPVLRDGRLVGQISRSDILRAIDEIYLREGR